MVFFAADRLRDRQPARYQFVGFAIVDRAVRRTDVWEDPALSVHSQFGNLLIRRTHGGFEHFEPELPQKHWHKDWLWRMSDRATFATDDLDGLDRISPSTKINGRSFRVAPNYIIFGPEAEDTLVLAEPPVVATVDDTGRTET